MADEVKDTRAAGWKRDPSGRFAGRYWDGAGWTEHVVGHDRVTSTDPVPSQVSAPARPPEPAARSAVGAPAARPVIGSPRTWPRWTRLALPIAAVLVVVGVVISFDRRDSPSTTGGAPPVGGRRLRSVGDTARTGEFDVTVHGTKDPQAPGQFLRPDAGRHLVSVDVQITNTSSAQQGFSSLLNFHLTDSGNHEYDISFGEIQPSAPDGDVPPGQSLRGFVIFDVPDGAGGLRFRAQGGLSAPEVQFAFG